MPMPIGFLDDYKNTIFLETGFHRGDGIVEALRAGFECIYSCDISVFAYGWCSHRFQDHHDIVHLLLQDSREFLRDRIGHADLNQGGKWITDLGQASTFWLDAHWSGGNGEVGGIDGGSPADHPLLEELAIIGTHPLRDHTLLIDDVREFGQEPGWPSLDEVKSAIWQINPAYDFRLADGAEHSEDILVATVK